MAKAYAVLFTVPPMSKAIIEPRMRPSRTAFEETGLDLVGDVGHRAMEIKVNNQAL